MVDGPFFVLRYGYICSCLANLNGQNTVISMGIHGFANCMRGRMILQCGFTLNIRKLLGLKVTSV